MGRGKKKRQQAGARGAERDAQAARGRQGDSSPVLQPCPPVEASLFRSSTVRSRPPQAAGEPAGLRGAAGRSVGG